MADKSGQRRRFLIGIIVMLLLSIPELRAQAFTSGQSGSLVIGQKDLVTRAGGISQRGLTTPSGVAFDSSGNMWVADTTNNRILEFDAPFTDWENASVVIGHPDFVTRTSPDGPSILSGPKAIAFGSSGNLWVADSLKNRVAEFVLPFSNGEAPSVVIGQKTLSATQISTRTVNQSILIRPQALAFNSGNLWIADSGDARVLEFAPPFTSGMNASLVIGPSNFIRGQSRSPVNGSNLQDPLGLAFDSSGRLWISDSVNNRVLEFAAPFSSGMSASLVIGQPNLGARTQDTTKSTLQNPHGLAFDSSGDLWVADTQNNRALRFDTPFASGEAATLVLGEQDFTTRTTNVSAVTLAVPNGLAFDRSGNLWVAEGVNNRILEFVSTAVPEFPAASLAVVAMASLAVVVIVTRKLSSERPRMLATARLDPGNKS